MSQAPPIRMFGRREISLLPPGLSDISMCHKNRKRHVLEHMSGRAAEEEFSPRRMTIRSHDNQVGILFVGDVQDSGACLPIVGLESPGRDLGRVP